MIPSKLKTGHVGSFVFLPRAGQSARLSPRIAPTPRQNPFRESFRQRIRSKDSKAFFLSLPSIPLAVSCRLQAFARCAAACDILGEAEAGGLPVRSL